MKSSDSDIEDGSLMAAIQSLANVFAGMRNLVELDFALPLMKMDAKDITGVDWTFPALTGLVAWCYDIIPNFVAPALKRLELQTFRYDSAIAVCKVHPDLEALVFNDNSADGSYHDDERGVEKIVDSFRMPDFLPRLTYLDCTCIPSASFLRILTECSRPLRHIGGFLNPMTPACSFFSRASTITMQLLVVAGPLTIQQQSLSSDVPATYS